MPATMDKKAVEQSSFVVTVQFTDENDELVPPNTARWTLVDRDETVINGREQVEISSPSSEEDILLSGDDLQILEDEREEMRWLVLEATYDSDLGSDLPLNDQVEFVVVNLKYIT